MTIALRVGGILVALVASAAAAPFAYVPNSGDNTVSVIDTATDTVTATIPIAGAQPQTAAVSANGSRVYVGDLGGFGGKIHVIDAATNAVIASPSVFSGIFHLAISPDGSAVYGAGGSSVKVVDTATNAFLPPFISHPGTGNPLAVAFHPTLALAYAVGATFQSTMAIDTTTRTVSASIGTGTSSVAVHPDGTRAYTLLTCIGCFPPPGVTAFDTATNSQIFPSVATTGNQPHVLELDATGAKLYVTTHDTTLGALLSVIDTATLVEIAAVPVGTEIWGLAFHPDGSRLYVVDRGANAVQVVDPGTLAVLHTIPVGPQPFGRGKFFGPIAVCGDGTTTFPETCDDGNTADGDCCSSTCQSEAAGTPCPDATVCNGDETCDGAGACVVGPPLACHDGNPCTLDTCDALAGCLYPDALAGTPCPDATVCNGDETCDGAGGCLPGTPLTCVDGLPCTLDTCDASAGCLYPPAPAGTPCPDATVCNGAETCDAGGTCLPGTPLVCQDTTVCTVDTCDATAGCVHTPTPAPACVTAARSVLTVVNPNTANARLSWQWNRGGPLQQGDLADPTTTASYTLCVFSGAGNALAASPVLPPGAGWAAVGSLGYRFNGTSPNGLTTALMRGTGSVFASKALVRGRGLALPDPPMPLDLPVTVQLVKDGSPVCLESVFTSAAQNVATRFRARTP
jgi:YVTN family beta-propeller protein/cysteine-rich repeat protein